MAYDRVVGDEIHLTHEFLAQMLGARRATVTQAASELRDAGAMEYHRGRITVIDRTKLEKAACGCYAVVKRELDGVFP